jgi:hypothetical protein
MHVKVGKVKVSVKLTRVAINCDHVRALPEPSDEAAAMRIVKRRTGRRP